MKYITSALVLAALFGSQESNAIQLRATFADDLVKELAEDMAKDVNEEDSSQSAAQTETKAEPKAEAKDVKKV